jgi:hypothetical protein
MSRRDQWPDTVSVSQTDLMRRRAIAEDLNRRYEWKTGRPRRQRIVLLVLAVLVAAGLYLVRGA